MLFVEHKDRQALYKYYLKPLNDNQWLLSLLYFDRVKDTDSNTVILNMKLKHFFGKSENEVLLKANEWVKLNLGLNFIIKETAEDE